MTDLFLNMDVHNTFPVIKDFDNDIFILNVHNGKESKIGGKCTANCDILPVCGCLIQISSSIYHTGGIRNHTSLAQMTLIHIQTELFKDLGETMPKDRCHHSMVHTNPLSLYVVGGIEVQLLNQKPVLHSAKYLIHSRKWYLSPPINTPRLRPGLCSFNQQYIFCLGGTFNDEIINTFEILDTCREETGWKVEKLPYVSGISEVACIQNRSNEILCFGGVASNGYTKESYVYHWKEKAWQKNVCPYEGKFSAECVLLVKGRVYAMSHGEVMRLVEYDVKKNVWDMKAVERWNKLIEYYGKRKFELMLEKQEMADIE